MSGGWSGNRRCRRVAGAASDSKFPSWARMVRGGRNHRSAVCAASRESRCSDTSLSCRNLRARSSVDGERNKCLRLRSVGWSSPPSCSRGPVLDEEFDFRIFVKRAGLLRVPNWALCLHLHSSQSSADAVLQHTPQLVVHVQETPSHSAGPPLHRPHRETPG